MSRDYTDWPVDPKRPQVFSALPRRFVCQVERDTCVYCHKMLIARRCRPEHELILSVGMEGHECTLKEQPADRDAQNLCC